MKRLPTIIGISVSVCGLIGSVIAVDTRYAIWVDVPDWAQGKEPVFKMEKHLFFKL